MGILQAIFSMFIEMTPYLLFGLLFVGILNLSFSTDMVVKYLGKDNFFSSVKAALLGVPLPLCSCGVIPSTVYISKNGASKGAVVSFLISTPQTGVDSIFATYGMMGWFFAIFRPIAAFIMGITGGFITHLFVRNDGDKKNSVVKMTEAVKTQERALSASEKFKELFSYPFVRFLDDISVQFAMGIILSGFIYYFIPNDFFVRYNLNSGLPAMFLLMLLGIPMYICATASIPIAITLIAKGFSPGAAFVFLAAGPATNAASISILLHALGKKMLFIFLGTVAILSVSFGLILDYLFDLFGLDAKSMISIAGHEHGKNYPLWQYVLAGIFLLLLLASLYRKLVLPIFHKILKKEKIEDRSFYDIEIPVEGMTCQHCVTSLEKSISSLPGIEDLKISLDDKKAYVRGGSVDYKNVINVINSKGYQAFEELEISVSGMTCQHCVKSISSSLEKLKGVLRVLVSLEESKVRIHGTDLDEEKIKETIKSLGYIPE